MITVRFDNEIQQAAPSMEVLAIEAELTNPPTSDALWAEVTDTASGIARKYSLQQINKRPAIAATRAAYKALGKEPNRYRPSAEALCRRAVKGMGLYRIDSLVDIINIVSMQSGYSIGGFDADIIDGDTVTLGRGRQAEPFEAIGRGQLNIEGLPVYRDDTGPIMNAQSLPRKHATSLCLSTFTALKCRWRKWNVSPEGYSKNIAASLLSQQSYSGHKNNIAPHYTHEIP